jgi:hypothetical protein
MGDASHVWQKEDLLQRKNVWLVGPLVGTFGVVTRSELRFAPSLEGGRSMASCKMHRPSMRPSTQTQAIRSRTTWRAFVVACGGVRERALSTPLTTGPSRSSQS